MSYFFDVHCHVMTLQHPNLVNFLNSLSSYLPDFLTSGTFSPTYLLGGKNRYLPNMLQKVNNTLRAFEGPVSSIFSLMDDDLRGVFYNRKKEADYPEKPFFRDGQFFFRNKIYEKVAICPLLMDFSETPQDINDSAYYPAVQGDKITRYAEDILQGIAAYKEERPNHIFEIYPLLGITPTAHSVKEIERLLITYVATTIPQGKQQFYGIKAYPPLGFDAWPGEKKERMKMEAIYEFCTAYKLPIITHCDDQGFRTIPSKKAWALTEPNHFIPALERYPELIIDFAHFGYRYSLQGTTLTNLASTLVEQIPTSPWFPEIIEMMELYPNVYSDFSFSGVNPQFYTELINFLKTRNEEDRKNLEKRMLFGSDFSINLFKMESYSQYYRIFEESGFTDEEIDLFASQNPMEFLGLNRREA